MWTCEEQKNVNCVFNIFIYLDILTPIKCFAVLLQQEVHDLVKAIHRIAEFTWIPRIIKFTCID